MGTMIVYRVEHKVKTNYYSVHDEVNLGPYVGATATSKSAQRMSDAHNNDYTHPSIRDDIKNWWGKDFERCDHFCCFVSMEQLRTWFDGFFETLNRRGFVIAEYEVDVEGVIEGMSGLQAVFNANMVCGKKIIGKVK